MSTVIRDLHDEAVKTAALPGGDKWVKWVTKIDPSQSNTYAFVGNFVERGTVQIKVGIPRLLLVGVRLRRGISEYRFVIMEDDGTLTQTDIHETDEKRGWALRVRDRVQMILDQHKMTPSLISIAPAVVSSPSAPPPSLIASGAPPASEEARTIAIRSLAQHAVSDRLKTAALLRDGMAGQYELELNLLVTALAEGVVDALQTPINGTPASLVHSNLTERLVARRGVYRELAAWTVKTWAMVLEGRTP